VSRKITIAPTAPLKDLNESDLDFRGMA